MVHAGGVEGRSPASVIILSQLQVVALAVHPHGDVPNPGPRLHPRAESMKGAVVGGHRAPGEAQRRYEERPAFPRFPA